MTYAITYGANGATTGTVPAQQIKSCDVAISLASNSGVLARDGHLFSGWNTSINGTGTDYPAGESYTTNAPLTLFAKWTPVYTVTYNGNGHTNGSVPVDINKYTNTQPVTVLNNTGTLVKTGHSFAGWNTNSNGTGTQRSPGSTFAIGAANVVLYAVWAPVYTVSFDGQGAMVEPNPATKLVVAPATTVGALPTPPTKTSYTFAGWWTGTNGSGTELLATTPVTSNLSVYAKWVIKDIDGNSYSEVKIGNQVWMVENLKTTRYNDGVLIPHISTASAWKSLYSCESNPCVYKPGYCWYDNDSVTNHVYGALYSWAVVGTGISSEWLACAIK